MHAYVEVIRADGHVETHPLEGEQITFGSGAEAAISITDVPELESVHLLLAPRDEGCWVSVAQGAEAVAWVGGKKHENGMLKWGTEIDIGSISLRINHRLVEERERQARRRRLTIIATMVVVLVLFSLLLKEERERLPRRSADAPALFEDPAPCPESERTAARARAHSANEEAQARLVRYPFDAQDGITAVALFGVANKCFAAAGESEIAASIAAERDRIAAQIEEDYQLRRVRLSRLLKHKRRKQALGETKALLIMLEHREGPYRNWLIRLQRHLELKLEGKRSRSI
jgi:hypothetical protein